MATQTTVQLTAVLPDFKYWDNKQQRSLFQDMIDSGTASIGNPANVQELTATGSVTATTRVLELNHTSTIIVSALSVAPVSQLMFVKDTSATGTAAHTCTITTGTWDGTNKVITLNALNEAILVYFDSAGNGTIIENVGGVALS